MNIDKGVVCKPNILSFQNRQADDLHLPMAA